MRHQVLGWKLHLLKESPKNELLPRSAHGASDGFELDCFRAVFRSLDSHATTSAYHWPAPSSFSFGKEVRSARAAVKLAADRVTGSRRQSLPLSPRRHCVGA